MTQNTTTLVWVKVNSDHFPLGRPGHRSEGGRFEIEPWGSKGFVLYDHGTRKQLTRVGETLKVCKAVAQQTLREEVEKAEADRQAQRLVDDARRASDLWAEGTPVEMSDEEIDAAYDKACTCLPEIQSATARRMRSAESRKPVKKVAPWPVSKAVARVFRKALRKAHCKSAAASPRGLSLRDTAIEALKIVQAYAYAADMDAGFDAGEFSGPAIARAEERAVTLLADLQGYSYDMVMDEVAEYCREEEARGDCLENYA